MYRKPGSTGRKMLFPDFVASSDSPTNLIFELRLDNNELN